MLLQIILTKNNQKLRFEHILETSKGYLETINIEPRETMEIIQISQTTKKKVEMDTNHVHYKLGHPYSHRLKLTSKAMDITITGELNQCLACLKVKSRKKT